MWIVSSAVNAVDNLSTARIIPRQLTVDNFVELFTNPLTPAGVSISNTWKVAIVPALGNVTLAALVAFAFSRLHFRGRRVGLLSLVLGLAGRIGRRRGCVAVRWGCSSS